MLVVVSLEHSVSYNDGESCPCYYVFLIIAINDLREVLNVIYDLNNWKQLGLQLGLFYPTLKRIDLEERGIVTSCIIELLSAWLELKDNVCVMAG